MTSEMQVLTKKTFLCAENYDEGYFDFHCLPGGKAPADGTDWYTACGTPYSSHLEYKIVVTAFSLIGLFVYFNILARSGKQPSTKAVSGTVNKSKKHKSH